MDIDLDVIYRILSDVARNQGQITYGELSNRYAKITGNWHDPHGSWDEPLGRLNTILNASRWQPLSAVVVLKETYEPGGQFWGSSPNIPVRPPNDLNRITAYGRILSLVHGDPWPTEDIPLEPPANS